METEISSPKLFSTHLKHHCPNQNAVLAEFILWLEGRVEGCVVCTAPEQEVASMGHTSSSQLSVGLTQGEA